MYDRVISFHIASIVAEFTFRLKMVIFLKHLSADYSDDCLTNILLFTKRRQKHRTGREATCELNLSSYWPVHRQTLMTSERCSAPVNHPHGFLLIYGFRPVDKAAGDGLSGKLKGQLTKTNSACFPRDFLLDNMKQIHLRHRRPLKYCVVSLRRRHLNSSDCLLINMLFDLIKIFVWFG